MWCIDAEKKQRSGGGLVVDESNSNATMCVSVNRGQVMGSEEFSIAAQTNPIISKNKTQLFDKLCAIKVAKSQCYLGHTELWELQQVVK
jgi:hypothetical protein